MADDTFNGQGAFPNLNDLAPVSGGVEVQDRPTTPGLAELGGDLQQFAQTVGQMADKATAERGRQAGAGAAEDGTVKPQNPVTIFGQAYNDAAKEGLRVQREAAMTQQMGAAYADHPNDPQALGQKLGEIRAGFDQTPWKDLDAHLDGVFVTQQSEFMNRAQLGLKSVMSENQVAAFDQAATNGGTQLDTVAAGAPFNPQGWAAVAGQLHTNLQSYARFGPKTAFSVGGQDFPADESRGGMVSPAEIQKRWQEDQQQAKTTWIYNQAIGMSADQLGNFIGEVQGRYKANDPMIAGLDGNHFDALERRLQQLEMHAETREQTQLTRAGQQANQLMDAWQWGGDVAPGDMVAAARASGRPDLVARAQFYAQTPQYTRGVLKTVVARQAGLIGPQDDNPWVDATGNPVASPAAPAPPQAGKPGAPNPGMANPQTTLEGVLGAGVNITSAARTPQHNAAVGGVPNSYHLTGHAVDFEPPPGQTNAQAVAKLKASGLPFVELLNEGDHVHVAWNGPAAGQVWSPPANVKPGAPAFRAWEDTKQGFGTDPIDYARGNQSHAALADVPILVPGGFASQDPAAQGAWAKALQGRQALGQTLASRYAVPPRLLTNGEREFYKAEIQANPAAAVSLAQAANAAIGGDGARRMLAEIGVGGPEAATALHLADLHLMGANGIVNSALQGMQIKADGGKAPAYSKTDPDAQLSFDSAQIKIAPALRYAPEALNAARKVAELARTGDAARGIDRPPEAYLMSALGGQTGPDGRAYGGVGVVNGQYALLPPWLSQDHAVDALKALGANWQAQGHGPQYSNGQVVTPRDAARLQLAYRPNGHYWLVEPRSGSVMRGATGAPFELDFDGARRFLSQTVPGAVAKGR